MPAATATPGSGRCRRRGSCPRCRRRCGASLHRRRLPANHPTTAPSRSGRAGAYAAAALAGECAKVRTTAPGGRNHAVNRAAFKLACLMVTGALAEVEITAALAEAAATAGLGKVEAAHAIASGLAAGQDPTRHQALARRQGGGAR